MSKIILVAETGSDLTAEAAEENGIHLVPMHVSFGDKTLDDGAFPSEDICDYYQRTGTLPQTSGSSPEDFAKVFDAIHAAHPDSHILHLAYSAVTTVSYQSAVLAAEGRDYVTIIDTKQVSIGQANIVLAMARYLEQNPELTIQEAAAKAGELIRAARFCFIPDKLEYLHAGGRISNAAYFLGGRLLRLHPCVDLQDGKLVATKKYRGRLENAIRTLIAEYSRLHDLRRDSLMLLYTVGFSDRLKQTAEETAKKLGYRQVSWTKAHGVITTHGGPNAFAMAGFSNK